MAREELPFVAELLNVHPSQERWRTAIEVTLGSLTSRMVVPQDRIREVSAAVDGMHWTARMGFDSVPVDLPEAGAQDRSSVAGKLEVAEGKFAGWVSHRVSASNALCVETAAELQGPGKRVSLAGQSRNGERYAHGRSAKDRNIIGFDNAAAIAAHEADLAAAKSDEIAADRAYDAVETERQELRLLSDAHTALTQSSFAEFDVRGSEALITTLRTDREKLLTADDALTALKDHLEEAERVRQERTKAAGWLEEQHKKHAKEWDALVKRADQLTDAQMGTKK